MSSIETSSRSTSDSVGLSTEDIRTKYELRSLLGEGSTAKIYRGKHKVTGDLVSIKCFLTKPLKGELQFTTNEIEALQKIKHPNIIRLVEIFDNPNQLSLVLERADGGDLFDRIRHVGKFTEKDASGIVYQVLDAVAYLHDTGIVHRNLKPENLLYKTTDDDSKIMLSNFGFSKTNVLEGMTLKTPCGSLPYIAPEILRHQTYGSAVDVWSIGIITHTLLCGYPPFYAENDQDLFNQIEKAKFDFASPYWDTISDAAKCFVRKLLDEDPNNRYTCRQAMQDPWICGEAAGIKNIHETISSNLKKDLFAKNEWKKVHNVFGAASEMRKMTLGTSTEGL